MKNNLVNESSKNDERIVNDIKSKILELYPVGERLDILMPFPPKRVPGLELELDFSSSNDNKNKIMYGSYNASTYSYFLEENDFISKNALKNLIDFILDDHEIISLYSNNGGMIVLTFDVNLQEKNMKGITCGKITLKLGFTGFCNFEKVKQEYDDFILENYIHRMTYTSIYRNMVEDRVFNTKLHFSKNASKEELLSFLSKLDKDDLKSIILKLDNQTFMNTYCSSVSEEEKNSDVNVLSLKKIGYIK